MPLPSPLPTTLTTSLALISSFLANLSTSAEPFTSTQSPTNSPNPDPLSLLNASALALKSYTTKLSLLAATPPFTPSAINAVLHELNTSVLPSLVTAALLCTPETYTRDFSKEAKILSIGLLKKLGDVLRLTEKVARAGGIKESAARKEEFTDVTGRVWEACGDVVALAKGGIVGFVVKRAEEWRALVKDVVEELGKWDPDDEEGNDDAFGSDQEDEGEGGEGEEAVDKEGVRERKKATVKMLNAVEKIYAPMIKRRLKTFPKSASDEAIKRLDKLQLELKVLPDAMDELAGAFYDLDEEGITARVVLMGRLAEECSRNQLDWDGQEDELTQWSKEWVAVVGSLVSDARNGSTKIGH